MKNKIWMLILVMGIALAGAQRLQAQVNTAPGVARVSLTNGQVSTQRGGNGEWVAVTINQPLVAGDLISTASGSRAEVQLDYANVLRLGSESTAKIASLSSSQIEVQLAQGLADVTVMKGAQSPAIIDTPNMAVHPLEPGVYRVEVISQSETRVTVRKGHAQVSTQQGNADLKQDEMMTVEGTENPQYQIAKAPGKDAWDQWNDQRNHVIEDARSWQYDNRYYTGTQDLDANGQWVYVPGYDWCWTPYVDAGWIPYYNGHWVYEPYYGWTWVSYEPWGWAPYHYGRWFFYGSSWCWWPGPVYPAYRPIWAPAYVSFFGFGGRGFGFGVGIGFGFGFGSIGWMPIGPADPFYRWWGHGGRYNVVNVTNITNITNIRNGRNYGYMAPLAGSGRPAYSNLRAALSNASIRRSIVTVPSRDFGTGRSFQRQAVSAAQFRQAQSVSGRVPAATPTRATLNAGMRPASRASIPSGSVSSRSFFTPRQQTASFNSRTADASSRGTTFSRQPAQAERTQTMNNGAAAREGWQRFGGQTNSDGAGRSSGFTSAQAPASRNYSTQPSENNARQGWQRFGGQTNAGRTQQSSGFGQERAPASRGFSAQPSPNGARQGWHTFTAQPRQSFNNGGYSRGSGGNGFGRSSGYSSRPPLELNRPIVTSRSSGNGGYRGSWSRGYYNAGTSRSSGSHVSAPRGGGGGGGSRGGGGGGRR